MNRQARTNTLQGYWPASQAYILAVITLVVGFALGYLVRGSGQPSTTSVSSTAQNPTEQNANATVAPMLRQLQQTPRDPQLLAQIGNHYFDSKDYPKAIDYYRKSLEVRPGDVDVRTDLGTALWYEGNADEALKEYEQSLRDEPNHPQTLFNVGIVKWQGKKDVQGAIETWESLLKRFPDYPERQRVEGLIKQLKSGGA
ncbi:MAG TPA: tetratricopeptide repeat protein [Clostridia bacterium]|nr:tetratricopeptide repeat protein [Clostridia bacterium]